MILAKELRIGNLVNTKNGIKKVTEIGIDYDCFFTQDHINPIPLTEEWLLKFGYIKIGNNYLIQGHSIWICNDLFMCDKNGMILKHVHQLQNLYFALTNKELNLIR